MAEFLKIDDFEELFEIMERSFPIDEYRTKSGQKALFENKYYRVLGEKRGGKLVGFLAYWEFPDITYLEHLATCPECRNGGIGNELLNFVLSRADKPVCLEVEHPTDEITTRRVNYYKRIGFSLNLYPYIQPPLSEGRAPVELYVMTLGGEINEEQYLKIKNTLYREVYKKATD